MLPTGIVHPEQLAILTEALEKYCLAADIEPGSPAHDDAGRQIMFLFECGFSTTEDLVKAMVVGNRAA
jgi:hypothetical protein